MLFNPTLPLTSSQVSSAELRAQFNGLKDLLDAQATQIADQQASIATLQAQLAAFPNDPASQAAVTLQISNAENQSAASINAVPELALVLANPPTTSDLQEILDTVNLIITTSRR